MFSNIFFSHNGGYFLSKKAKNEKKILGLKIFLIINCSKEKNTLKNTKSVKKF